MKNGEDKRENRIALHRDGDRKAGHRRAYGEEQLTPKAFRKDIWNPTTVKAS